MIHECTSVNQADNPLSGKSLAPQGIFKKIFPTSWLNNLSSFVSQKICLDVRFKLSSQPRKEEIYLLFVTFLKSYLSFWGLADGMSNHQLGIHPTAGRDLGHFS